MALLLLNTHQQHWSLTCELIHHSASIMKFSNLFGKHYRQFYAPFISIQQKLCMAYNSLLLLFHRSRGHVVILTSSQPVFSFVQYQKSRHSCPLDTFNNFYLKPLLLYLNSIRQIEKQLCL